MIRNGWCLRTGFALFLSIAIVGLTARERKPDEIRIGVIAYRDSENTPTSGESTVNAAQLVAQSVNDAGGMSINGRWYALKLIVEYIAYRPEMAVNAARKLIFTEGVAAIVGPQYSG